MDHKFNTSPNLTDLNKIKSWLITEHEVSNEGFYCNWNIIEKAQSDKKLITLSNNNLPIGFITWYQNEIYAAINIMEMEPKVRSKGLGKLFLQKFEEYVSGKGLVTIKLFCSSKESESFWKKMNFIKFPNRGYSESNLTYFKPLIEVNQPIDSLETNKIELWDLEPYQVKNNKPKWTWKIESNILFKPIIQPCNADWNIRWTRNGEVIKENKVKYFQQDGDRIEFSPFLYVRKLYE